VKPVPQLASEKDQPGSLRLLGLNVPVRTHLGENGRIVGSLWNGQHEVEIDDSEDKQPVKRWQGNIREAYSASELTPLCVGTFSV
jgi:hypothetical protein